MTHGDDGSAKVWSLETYTELARFGGEADLMQDCILNIFFQRQRLLVREESSKKVDIWSLDQAVPSKVGQIRYTTMSDCKPTPDEKYLYVLRRGRFRIESGMFKSVVLHQGVRPYAELGVLPAGEDYHHVPKGLARRQVHHAC